MIYGGNCVNSTGKNSGSEEITALLKEIGGRDVRKIIYSIYFCTLFGEFFFLPFLITEYAICTIFITTLSLSK